MLGIEDLRLNDLRHEATSRLFERGYQIHEVAQFTLHGVTRPLNLTLESFKCMKYPDGKEHCGADASGTFNRADYGISYGDKYGFKMDVKLAIQVEGIRGG